MNPSPPHGKEARRLQAWPLKHKGWAQRRIAEAFGVSAGAVSPWMTRARHGGLEALRHGPPPGAPRRLTDEQLARLPALLQPGAEAYGFRGEVWTRARVAVIMRLACGVSSHPVHVGRLLKAIRWSPQKPMRWARQCHEAAIARWRDETWPAIKKGRRLHSKPSCF